MSTPNIHLSTRMTETEALMWAAESDPWLSSGMGSLFLLDDAPDFDRFTAAMLDASQTLTRLRERVVDGFGFAPPRWVIDDEFDISDHVRHVQLPKPGNLDQLLELAAQTFQDPFDTSRPLWEFVAVSGAGGRKAKSSVAGAIIMKLHHSVSDGIGALRLAEMYLDLERHPPVDEPTTVVAPEAGLVAARDAKRDLVSDVGFVAQKQFALTRKIAGEVLMWGADSERPQKAAKALIDRAKATSSELAPARRSNGSTEWVDRSRQRHLEVFDLPLADLKAASKRLGGSVNDAFVAGSVLGVHRYHEAAGRDVAQFNLSFVMSTRNDDAAGGNAFTPIPFSLDGDLSSIEAIFAATQREMGERRVALARSSADALSLAVGFASLLPASILSKAGRARAASQDWATSNLRGAPIPIYTAGAEITHMYPIGPVAGTAFNLTAMSYCDALNFGCFLDPHAVKDPELLRSSLLSAYVDLCEWRGS